MIPRTERGPLAEWWWTVDRTLFGVFVVMLVVGIITSLTASPPLAIGKDLSPWHFIERQVFFATFALGVMFYLSCLSFRTIKRLSLIILLVSFILLVLVLIIGDPTKGARRWIPILSFSIQPSELLKPGFIVITAWLIAEWDKRGDLPVAPLLFGMLIVTAILLALEPDIGQTMLFGLTWSALVFFAGLRTRWIALLSGIIVTGLATAYLAFSHVHDRINGYIAFVFEGHNDQLQVKKAFGAILNGGWIGEGVGEGNFIRRIPDAHTDFIFAVIVEEYGAIAGIMLIMAYLIICYKCFYYALLSGNTHIRLCLCGMATLISFQAIIHIGVNIAVLPPTGITLPFISYGGSSLLSMGIMAGMILAMAKKHL